LRESRGGTTMLVLFVTICVVNAIGIFLFLVMYRRDEPVCGVCGLVVFCIAGIMAATYGLLDSA
jgi:hypothetical protein